MEKKQLVPGNRMTVYYKYEASTPFKLDESHCHDCYEILYILSGCGRYVLEGSTFDIKPGTLMIIKPYEYHCVSISPDCTSYERYVINFFDDALVDEAVKMLMSMLGEDIGGKYYPAGSVKNNVSLLFERFESALSVSLPERDLYLKMLLSEMIVLLSECGGKQMAQDTEELGARVIRYINENIEKDISLDRLSRRFFVSKYYLCRAFKKHNGISIHGYINQKRVMRAKQLIEAGETASGAAYRVGFGDYSSFYRAYVKVVGRSPTSN